MKIFKFISLPLCKKTLIINQLQYLHPKLHPILKIGNILFKSKNSFLETK